MRLEAVTATRSNFGPEQCFTGASATLAEARKIFLQSAPEMSWAELTSRANLLRANEPMTLLQAIAVVHHQLAQGR